MDVLVRTHVKPLYFCEPQIETSKFKTLVAVSNDWDNYWKLII